MVVLFGSVDWWVGARNFFINNSWCFLSWKAYKLHTLITNIFLRFHVSDLGLFMIMERKPVSMAWPFDWKRMLAVKTTTSKADQQGGLLMYSCRNITMCFGQLTRWYHSPLLTITGKHHCVQLTGWCLPVIVNNWYHPVNGQLHTVMFTGCC